METILNLMTCGFNYWRKPYHGLCTAFLFIISALVLTNSTNAQSFSYLEKTENNRIETLAPTSFLNLQSSSVFSNFWNNLANNNLENLPDGYYTFTNKDREENGSFIHLVKKGDFFLAGGYVYGIANIPNKGIYSLTCAKGRFKQNYLLFDEIIELKKDYNDSFEKNFTFEKYIDLPEINTNEFLNVIEEKNIRLGDLYIYGVCNDFLPLVSNRLRVVDPTTNEHWNLSGLLEGSKVDVIPVDSPKGVSVMEMPVSTNQTNEFYNGRFSSLRTTKGSEKNLIDDKQYFLRVTLHYADNISVSNEQKFLGETVGCVAPPQDKKERIVLRDSKPFTVKKGLLNKLMQDNFPWGAGHNTSTPSGKAAFDRDVVKYYQGIDNEMIRIMSQPTNINFPPPIFLIHGILNCYTDWENWNKELLERRAVPSNPNSPMAGLITFTPNYDYRVKDKWKTVPELKTLRDQMALSISNQMQKDIVPFLHWYADEKPPNVYVIAHSNGGIVARPLSKINNSSWNIKKIYTMGSPHSGTLVPFANDFGLNGDQMVKYNCLEKGFNPSIDVAAFAGNGYSNGVGIPPDKTLLTTPFFKSYIQALGNEKFNDGAVYPHGSTNIILCGNSGNTFSIIQKIKLMSTLPLYHSKSFPIVFPKDKGNFLDIEGVKLFDNFIATDMGLK